MAYKERNFRIYAYGHPWVKVCRSLEELVLNVRYGNFANIRTALQRRIAKWTGSFRHA